MKRIFAVLAGLALVLGAAAIVHANTALLGSVPGAVQSEGSNGGYQQSGQPDTIWNSYHNLSYYMSGVNPMHATSDTETEVCAFCHTPHQASTPDLLWNRQQTPWGISVSYQGSATSGTNVTVDFGALLETGEQGTTTVQNGYSIYNGISLDPESLRCMTCHDGYTSVGQVAGAWQPGGTVTTLPMTGGNGGVINAAGYFFGSPYQSGDVNLKGNHPVSVPYPDGTTTETYNGMTANQRDFNTEAAIEAIDSSGAAQPYDYLKGVPGHLYIACTSCHDVHGQQNPANSSDLPPHLGQMIRQGTNGSALCAVCHIR